MRAKVDSGSTALVSYILPSGPHIVPPARIIAGIEASTITSFGLWRLLMPLAESTIDRRGRRASQALMSASISARFASGRARIFSSTLAKPLFTFTPSSAKVFACFSNTSL